MVPALIVIELAPPEAPPALAAALVDACNHGPEAGIECALATDDNGTVSPRLAVVTWRSAEHLAVDVQVGVQSAAGGVWSTRHLDFAESDAELERWRAVGLVIATLARQGETAAAAPPPAAPPKPPEPPAPAAPATSPPSAARPRWMLDLAGALSHGQRGLDVPGASLRLSRRVLRAGVYLGAAARYDTLSAAEQVRLHWGSLGLGLGLSLPLGDPRVTLDARLEPSVELVWAKLGSSGASASGVVWGARGGAGLGWWLSSSVAAVLSLEATQLNRATEARIVSPDGATEHTTRVPALTWGTSVGLRFAFGGR